METYDYCIIGAGPTACALVHYLAKYNNKILLIDKESSIGGCHRVRRVDGLFTEHGPRIYLKNYFSLIDILSDMDLTFDDIFTQYNFTINNTLSENVTQFTYSEILSLAYEFIKFIIDDEPSKHITMLEFTESHNFSAKAKSHLDNLCRLIDGGQLMNFTIFEFFQTINQNYFYTIYQPKLPNDVGLFKHWQDHLLKTGNVTIKLDTEVLAIKSDDKVTSITVKSPSGESSIVAKRYIMCMPPQPALKLIQNSDNPNMFGDINELAKWEKQSRYLIYIPIIFHWNKKVNTKKIWGLTETDYSIVYVVLSDYMDFQDDRSKTVITCSVKITNRKSKFNGKTADECNKEELIKEVFRQLQEHQPSLPGATTSILSPGVYKNESKKMWETTDTAYFFTKAGYKSNKSVYDNLFWCGIHNGNSNYSFTAMESAIENGIALVHELEPASKNIVKIHKPMTVKNIILIILIIIFLIISYIVNIFK